MFYNALDSFAEREIGMKKIYLLLFLCACITLCVRVNGGIKLEGEKTESCNKIILSHIKKLMGEIDLKQEVAITLNYDVKTRTDKRTDF